MVVHQPHAKRTGEDTGTVHIVNATVPEIGILNFRISNPVATDTHTFHTSFSSMQNPSPKTQSELACFQACISRLYNIDFSCTWEIS